MANRLLNLAALGSAAVFCLVLVAWAMAGRIDPRRQHVSLSRDCHVSIDAHGADSRLEVFNDADYGPYCGSIIGIAGDPNGPTVAGFGDTAGVYYRSIQWPTGRSLWTFSLSLCYPLVVTAVLPIFYLVRRLRRRR
jgi:hypothetical protein